MQIFRKAVALSALSAMLLSGTAFAQDHRDDHGHDHDGPPHHTYVHHQEWRKGYRMHNEDWNRGERIDYRQNHLRRPPSGYEWRQVDGNYVMAAVATGVIASVVIAANSGR